MPGKRPPPVPILWRNLVTARPDIDAVEWAVAMALSMRMDNKTGKCWPGFATIGRMAHIGRSSVVRGIEGLQEKGLLHRERRYKTRADGTRSNDTNVYTALLSTQGDLTRPADDPRPQGEPSLDRRANSISSEISETASPSASLRDSDEEAAGEGSGATSKNGPRRASAASEGNGRAKAPKKCPMCKSTNVWAKSSPYTGNECGSCGWLWGHAPAKNRT
jgi:hypothetical protein